MAFPSPDDWRTELVYFLLPDRFSDGREHRRPVLRADAPADDAARHPEDWDGPLKRWYWNQWAISGRNRFQGGTIPGITSKLGYLHDLGVTALWLGPVWKQRVTGVDSNANGDGTDDPYYPVNRDDLTESGRGVDFRALQLPRDDYHAYAIQDFGDVDPRFGTRADLVDLVRKAHDRDMRVIFDMMINHSGENFAYDVPDTVSSIRPPYREKDFRNLSDESQFPDLNVEEAVRIAAEQYRFGGWLDRHNRRMDRWALLAHPDDGVWPASLQNPDLYSRQGSGDYGAGDVGSAVSQFRVADYRNRDFAYPPVAPQNPRDPAASALLAAMVEIWCRWIDDTDCDGFRVDTFKHVPIWIAQEFVRRIREHAKGRGKENFLMMGEVGGGSRMQAEYLQHVSQVNILELADGRRNLRGAADGDPAQAAAVLAPPQRVGVSDHDPGVPVDHARLVMTIDDHDGLNLPKQVRLAATARRGTGAVLPASAFLIFGPSIPCLYYGTEQALRGPVWATGGALDAYGGTDRARGGDRYLREAMFGPRHPRRPGAEGRPGRPDALLADDLFDTRLPGFGPRGTAGYHVFDTDSPWYRGIAALGGLRREHAVLATGEIRQLRGGRVDGGRFADGTLPSTMIAWSRRHEATWAVVVVDLAPDGSPAATVDLALPGATGRYTRAVRIARDGKISGPDDPTDIPTTRQSELPYLPLGRVEPGEIRVYLSS